MPGRIFITASARERLPKILHGEGSVLAAGQAPAKVRYVLNRKEGEGSSTFSGTLEGSRPALHPFWLLHTSVLRLADSRRLAISITELDGRGAKFEVVERTELRD
jgi:hypothetical protein